MLILVVRNLLWLTNCLCVFIELCANVYIPLVPHLPLALAAPEIVLHLAPALVLERYLARIVTFDCDIAKNIRNLED